MAKKEQSVYERFQAAQTELLEQAKVAQDAQDKFLEMRAGFQALLKELPLEIRSLFIDSSAPRPAPGPRKTRANIDSADLARVKRKILDELTEEPKKFLVQERRDIAGDLETFKAAMAELQEENKAFRYADGPDRGIGMQYVSVAAK